MTTHKRRIGLIVAAVGVLLSAMAMTTLGQGAEAPATGVAPGATTAAAPTKVDSGDTAWVMLSAGLVMMMTPALAFFYGGLVRRKNVLSVLMQCFMILCIVSVQWVLFGYSLSFGKSHGGLIGGLEMFALNGVGAAPNADYAPTIPHSVFMLFQMMFAVITPALIIGAFAERMRFSAFCILTVLWSTLIYDPVCHWVWGVGGWLKTMGALDFAGGTVVHINAGIAALAAALILGKRQGFPSMISPPHSLPFATLGAGLLWFGWFGFNGGSSLHADGLAGSAMVATHVAAAVAGLTWAGIDWIWHGKPTTLGMITGAVAGLVAVTPAAGYVTPAGAIGIGIGAGLLPWLAVTFLKPRMNYDDTLDAFGVHGVGGIWGAIATGLWATKTVNESGGNGLFYGDAHQLVVQLTAVGATIVYAFVGSVILFKVVNVFSTLRAGAHEERVGLDLTEHKEAGYTIID
ncbi:MAG: ammonium transporter [Planctomycetota bacterium]|nr:ammonium transporter [Planctomycetota bacterium]